MRSGPSAAKISKYLILGISSIVNNKAGLADLGIVTYQLS
jgi:hypothetical protein